MTRNNLRHLDPSVFKRTPNLQTLDLSMNEELGATIQTNLVQLSAPLKKLRVLRLASTGLQFLPRDTFKNLTQLSTLTLSNNQITRLDGGMLQRQRKLSRLSISKNKLETFDNSWLGGNVPSELNVSHNTFVCNCSLAWFTNWIRTEETTYLDNLDKVTCKNPATFAGRKLRTVHLDRHCMSWRFYKFYWAMVLCISLAVTTCTMTFRWRWYLR